MSDNAKTWDNLNSAVVVSDRDFNVTYANKRAFEVFDQLEIVGLEVGKNMASCHQPETMVKLKELYQAFADKKIKVHSHTAEGPEGTLTVVAVPFFDGDDLDGVVEMVFESAVAQPA